MSQPLPLRDGALLVVNFLRQRAARCDQLGFPDDANRYHEYRRIVQRLAEAAGAAPPFPPDIP